jgi:methylated-DNA-[protein]-cysteine S-methyltransferase
MQVPEAPLQRKRHRREHRVLTLNVERVVTAIGTLVVLTDDENQLRAVDWSDYEPRMTKLLRLHYGAYYRMADAIAPSAASAALDAYFAGDLGAIDSLNVATAGTAFQRSVWSALRMVPVGRTTSYAALAKAIGRDSAIRAVGAANGANPIGVVVPCHRVIGSDASLTGYGGGIERKRWLLRHERALD